jgi:3,4-dihydroxy 2-butanone 4-phosphate synthase / GTP cyclohydrolase II
MLTRDTALNVRQAMEALSKGKMVILLDDESRENEGDFVCAAEFATADAVNFMALHGRGLICLALEPSIVDRLELSMMRDERKKNTLRETAFTVSIEARSGVTTGISAADRARTIQVAIDDASRPDDLVVPGHVFPLKAKAGGVLERAGHTEASVDLCAIAGLKKAAVICEIMKEDGSMARQEDLEDLAKKFEIPMLRVQDLIEYRLQKDSLVRELRSKEIYSERFSKLWIKEFCSHPESKTDYHLAVIKGTIDPDEVVDVRVHLNRSYFDFFTHLNGHSRLDAGLKIFEKSNSAVFLFINKDLIHFDLAEIFKTDREQDLPVSSLEYDRKQIGIGAQILRKLGVKKMRFHSFSSALYHGLSGFGLEIVEIRNMGEEK